MLMQFDDQCVYPPQPGGRLRKYFPFRAFYINFQYIQTINTEPVHDSRDRHAFHMIQVTTMIRLVFPAASGHEAPFAQIRIDEIDYLIPVP